MTNNYDKIAARDITKSSAAIYFWIAVASYAYYHKPECSSLLSDEYFDSLCKKLLDGNAITVHTKLNHLINEDRLRAGSLYDVLPHEYPVWLVRFADEFIMKMEDNLL